MATPPVGRYTNGSPAPSPLALLLIGLWTFVALGLACLGARALFTGCLYAPIRIGRGAQPMFPTPLHGYPAVVGGIALILLAASFLSICASAHGIAARLPRWTHRYKWWLFAAAMVFYLAAGRG